MYTSLILKLALLTLQKKKELKSLGNVQHKDESESQGNLTLFAKLPHHPDQLSRAPRTGNENPRKVFKEKRLTFQVNLDLLPNR